MLTVSRLNQSYGGSHILRDVTFELPPGKVTTLLGRNGVGKTTLLKALMGLVAVRTGQVRFEGRDLTKAKPHERARAGLPATHLDEHRPDGRVFLWKFGRFESQQLATQRCTERY